jgi:hypothetical protein
MECYLQIELLLKEPGSSLDLFKGFIDSILDLFSEILLLSIFDLIKDVGDTHC